MMGPGDTRARFSMLVVAGLGALLAAGLLVMVLGERWEKEQLVRQGQAQAELLASAVSAALAFEDDQAAADYVTAAQVNPNLRAAAVYDLQGELVARYRRPDEPRPSPLAPGAEDSVRFEDGRLWVVRRVSQGGQTLGAVRMVFAETSAEQRLARYLGLGLVLALAMLVVAVLASSQSALRRANAALADRARELMVANAGLREQIEEREKAEEALRQSQKMEAIGRLTGGVAHDFNNLLMVASSAADMLERTEDKKRRAKLLEGLRQAVERGAGLTRQLLAFSRSSPLTASVIDPAVRIRSLAILFERSLRENIEVDIQTPDQLCAVEVDAGEFELALLNLAVNARDAMPDGGRLTVRLLSAQRDGAPVVRIEMQDTGVGIAPDVQGRIFEPFFTTKEVGKGTGLGLSQVYGFARSSGGQITVRSRLGHGTTFILELPCTSKTLQEETLAVAPGGTRTGRLLLVEDDDAVAAGIGHMLRDLGYSYVRACDAADAERMIGQDGPFDLVLSDMVMPGPGDGLSLARSLAGRKPPLPILLMTGYSEAVAQAQAGGVPVLAKPYSIRDLDLAILSALGST